MNRVTIKLGPRFSLEAIQIDGTQAIKEITAMGFNVHLNPATYDNPAGRSDLIIIMNDDVRIKTCVMSYFCCLNGKHYFSCSQEELEQFYGNDQD